jgi:hypothetical protein
VETPVEFIDKSLEVTRMKTRVTAFVGVGVLLAALAFEAVKQAQAQGPGGFGWLPWGFVVVDSTGKPVGPVIGTGTGVVAPPFGTAGLTYVAIPFHRKDLPVGVSRSLLVAPDLYFTSSDCTGQPYAIAGGSPFLTTAISFDNTLYFESGPSESIKLESYQGYNFDCATCSITLSVVPVAPAVDLNEFKPPFSVVRRSLIP